MSLTQPNASIRTSAPTLLQAIDPNGAPPLDYYLQAVDALVQWQQVPPATEARRYDAAMVEAELALFPQWYIAGHRQRALGGSERKTLEGAFAALVAQHMACPLVPVHHAFSPECLPIPLKLPVPERSLLGPVGYDIACLTRAPFVQWEEDFCLDVTVRYWERSRKAGLPVDDDFGAFYRSVEWLGLQRHLMLAGDFAHQALQGDEPDLLAETPRLVAYMVGTCQRYRELKPLLRLIEQLEGLVAPTGFSFGRM
jgi:aminoglycoside/choline kinase family phosphotransferase